MTDQPKETDDMDIETDVIEFSKERTDQTKTEGTTQRRLQTSEIIKIKLEKQNKYSEQILLLEHATNLIKKVGKPGYNNDNCIQLLLHKTDHIPTFTVPDENIDTKKTTNRKRKSTKRKTSFYGYIVGTSIDSRGLILELHIFYKSRGGRDWKQLQQNISLSNLRLFSPTISNMFFVPSIGIEDNREIEIVSGRGRAMSFDDAKNIDQQSTKNTFMTIPLNNNSGESGAPPRHTPSPDHDDCDQSSIKKNSSSFTITGGIRRTRSRSKRKSVFSTSNINRSSLNSLSNSAFSSMSPASSNSAFSSMSMSMSSLNTSASISAPVIISQSTSSTSNTSTSPKIKRIRSSSAPLPTTSSFKQRGHRYHERNQLPQTTIGILEQVEQDHKRTSLPPYKGKQRLVDLFKNLGDKKKKNELKLLLENPLNLAHLSVADKIRILRIKQFNTLEDAKRQERDTTSNNTWYNKTAHAHPGDTAEEHRFAMRFIDTFFKDLLLNKSLKEIREIDLFANCYNIAYPVGSILRTRMEDDVNHTTRDPELRKRKLAVLMELKMNEGGALLKKKSGRYIKTILWMLGKLLSKRVSEGTACEWSTLVDIYMTPASFKPVSLLSLCISFF